MDISFPSPWWWDLVFPGLWLLLALAASLALVANIRSRPIHRMPLSGLRYAVGFVVFNALPGLLVAALGRRHSSLLNPWGNPILGIGLGIGLLCGTIVGISAAEHRKRLLEASEAERG